jgi:hypothetical protein
VRVALGPTFGLTRAPYQNVLQVTAPGTYNLDFGTNLVQVNVNGAVTINLPVAVFPAVPAVPERFVIAPITVLDAGGYAAAHAITIAAQGAYQINGGMSATIATSFGALTFTPWPTGTWSAR